jgi:phosphatidylinositol alpha-mannosyltransferase
VKIGLVCPYAWDKPGGVQAHVRDLAETLLARGHDVSVFTPAEDDDALPDYCVGAGTPIPIPYNGSVARLLLGPVSAGRTRKWLRQNDFDILHVHEPTAPSVTWVSCLLTDAPIVATFHMSNTRSRAMVAFEPFFVPALEKVRARIAVSEAARRTTVEHLGGDAVLIPNGVQVSHFAEAQILPGHPDGRTLAFVGRIDEPRKGLDVLLAALRHVPDARLLVVGPGEIDLDSDLAGRVELLGKVDEATKASVLRSADIFVAPNIGGESFGIVLLEAMAAGTAIVASDLDAFERVLADGSAGELFPAGDADALGGALAALLADAPRRASLAAAGSAAVAQFDWAIVSDSILRVYETVLEGENLAPAETRSGTRTSAARISARLTDGWGR